MKRPQLAFTSRLPLFPHVFPPSRRGRGGEDKLFQAVMVLRERGLVFPVMYALAEQSDPFMKAPPSIVEKTKNTATREPRSVVRSGVYDEYISTCINLPPA